MKEKIFILKSEIKNDSKKLNNIFDKFETAYKKYLDSEEYSRLVESAFYVNRLFSGFENMVKMDLNKDKFKIVADKVFSVREIVFKDINSFLDFLDSLVKRKK